VKIKGISPIADHWRTKAEELQRDLALKGQQAEAMRWIPVSERLPEARKGISYQCWDTGPVLVLHRDRPDYPLTAHATLGSAHDALGVRVPTKGVSEHPWICWYSIGRNLSNPFDMASGPDGAFKDSVGYERFLPRYFGAGITHWMPLPAAPIWSKP
jgi:Protein of unknown function (DUF551)